MQHITRSTGVRMSNFHAAFKTIQTYSTKTSKALVATHGPAHAYKIRIFTPREIMSSKRNMQTPGAIQFRYSRRAISSPQTALPYKIKRLPLPHLRFTIFAPHRTNHRVMSLFTRRAWWQFNGNALINKPTIQWEIWNVDRPVFVASLASSPNVATPLAQSTSADSSGSPL